MITVPGYLDPIATAVVVLLLGGIVVAVILNLIEHAVEDKDPEDKSELVTEVVEAEDGVEAEEGEEAEDGAASENTQGSEVSDESEDYSDMPGLVPAENHSEEEPELNNLANLTDEEDRIIGKKVNRFFSHTINELLKIRQHRNKRNKTE